MFRFFPAAADYLADHSLLRLILAAVSLLGMAIFLLPVSVRIVNAGNLGGFLFCLLLFGFTLFSKKLSVFLGQMWEKKTGHIVLSVLGVCFLLGILLCIILTVCMLRAEHKKPKDTPQAVVVLGCKVRGSVPSLMLSRRILAAYDALEKYPDAVCVASGGKGSDEAISEAECIAQELQRLGISADRILLEDKSASTSENLRFSKQILADHGITGQLLIVTDGYHECRAQYLAKKEGLPQTAAAPAYTSWYLLPTYWVREWFGLVHAFVFGD